ncbi:hypothetical protein F7725_002569 [Dissostichus mawsoni]|uniref:Uncharacterized protein n=1 Tax=Dissostichus mawsoni TaxID=36200 RepID=A0A7J5Y2Y0_DISMA|nr:hypothetical protein F7725_002569 [Dissostichus mawsoni]
MLLACCSHSSVEGNGLIYVCGGTVGKNISFRVLNNCEVYDPSTQKWREMCEIREVRKNHGLVAVNGRIYAVGGQGALGGLDSVEYYDIATNEWRAASPLPWRGIAVVGDIIYVLAGFHVLEYHNETDRWVTCSKVRAFPVTSCLVEIRANAISRVSRAYGPLLQTLHTLQEDRSVHSETRTKISGLLKQAKKARTVFGLLCAEALFGPCEAVAKVLQGEKATAAGALECVKALKGRVHALCNEKPWRKS